MITRNDGEIVFPVADGSSKIIRKRPRILRTHSGTGTHRTERTSGESQGDREEFQPEETKDDAETQKDFWSIQGDFIYSHHIEPRVQLYVPKEGSFTNPIQYIHVSRSTHTDLDVAQEKRRDDHWNVDGNRNLSDSWTGVTRFTLLNEKLFQKDICGPGGD